MKINGEAKALIEAAAWSMVCHDDLVHLCQSLAQAAKETARRCGGGSRDIEALIDERVKELKGRDNEG